MRAVVFALVIAVTPALGCEGDGERSTPAAGSGGSAGTFAAGSGHAGGGETASGAGGNEMGAGAGGKPGSGAGGAAGDSDAPETIVVRQFNRYGYASGNITEGPVAGSAIQDATVLVSLGGEEKRFRGERQPDGSFAIEGVGSNQPYDLLLSIKPADRLPSDAALLVSYPIADSARTVRLGSNYWGRQDAVQLADTEATKLALSVKTDARFEDTDIFSWIGLRSYFYRSLTYWAVYSELPEPGVYFNAPAELDETSQDWAVATSELELPYGREASGLPKAAAGDDLLILQTRSRTIVTHPRDEEPLSPIDVTSPEDRLYLLGPWAHFTATEAVGVLDVAAPDFSNDKTNHVHGTLTAPPKRTVTIAYDGDSFSAVRTLVSYPKDVGSRVSLELTQEAGEGPELYTSVAPTTWRVYTSVRKLPVYPQCYPMVAGDTCPLCEAGCDSSTDGTIDPGYFKHAFEIPRAYASGMRDIYWLSLSYSRTWRHPTSGESTTLSARVMESRPAAGDAEAFALKLGPVTHLRINGQSLEWDAANEHIGLTPTISFDPPTLGDVEYYQVYVTDLQPDADSDVPEDERRDSITVANIATYATTLTLPAGVLRAGHYYSISVYANADGVNFAEPQLAPREHRLSTGVFSPVFTP